MGNKGAYIRIGKNLELNFVQFDAVEHPPVPSMKYASLANRMMM
jgi:serine/threonine-protein phosphatase 5